MEVEALRLLCRIDPLMVDLNLAASKIGQRAAQPLFGHAPVRTTFKELNRHVHKLRDQSPLPSLFLVRCLSLFVGLVTQELRQGPRQLRAAHCEAQSGWSES